MTNDIQVFTTTPPYDTALPDYRARVAECSRWSDQHGCRGTLVYTDNSMLDPWLVAQVIIESTTSLRPLVAVQPVYMHPYSVAKIVVSLAHMHGRGVDMNMVAGGFKKDLEALDDVTPHDSRYDRVVEYTRIVTGLLAGGGPVSHAGEFHTVSNLRLTPPLPPDLMPLITLSGSSTAGRAAAVELGAVGVKYPRPDLEDVPREADEPVERGIRVGIIARETEDEAWAIAHARFPPDRRGQLVHQLAMAVSDSVWHRQLAEAGREARGDSPYWMVPYENYRTFCPYLVGDHSQIAEIIARYLATGHRTYIMDVPFAEDDLVHATVVFRMAADRAAGVGAPA
jgi:alkanesulfonate monooxygenase